jgi:RNA polymerase sigma-70 factor (ECF subfamily)
MSEGFNEKATIKLLAEGNRVAYTQVWYQYYDNVYRYSRKFLRSQEEAEEAVQEVFIRLWIYRRNLHTVENLEAYLFSIKKNVINTKLNNLIKGASINGDDILINTASESRADYRIRGKQIKAAYDLALRDMPVHRQRIFKMAKEDELSYDQIAGKLAISPNTVKFHMKEAFRFLKDRMKPFTSITLLTFTVKQIINLIS